MAEAGIKVGGGLCGLFVMSQGILGVMIWRSCLFWQTRRHRYRLGCWQWPDRGRYFIGRLHISQCRCIQFSHQYINRSKGIYNSNGGKVSNGMTITDAVDLVSLWFCHLPWGVEDDLVKKIKKKKKSTSLRNCEGYFVLWFPFGQCAIIVVPRNTSEQITVTK